MTARQLDTPKWIALRRIYEEFAVPVPLLAAGTQVSQATFDRTVRLHAWRHDRSAADFHALRRRLLGTLRERMMPVLNDPEADATEVTKLAQSLTRLMEVAMKLFETRSRDEEGSADDARASLYRKLDAFVTDRARSAR